MTILISVLILAATFAFAWLLSHGLPETMREVALWLIVEARRIDERREARSAATKRGLSAEAR